MAELRSDGLGLEVVWEGDPTTRIAADIVAVHGLAAGSSSTYCHENGSSLLRDLLARDTDLRNIRIFSFGYAGADAYYTDGSDGSQSTGRLMTFAEQLCSDLRNVRVDLRGSEKHRPIVFMAHGIGGLVVKRALVDHKDILRCTGHVLFFDTPHRGMDTQAWETMTNRVLGADAQIQFAVGSASLSELDRAFIGASASNASLRFTSFYSSRPTPTRGGDIWAIHESSTILGIDAERCCQLDRTSHMTMLKYPDTLDQMYKRIKMCLREVLLRLPSQGTGYGLVVRGNHELQQRGQVPVKVLDWLSSYDHESNQQRLSAIRLPNTVEWLLRHETFMKWFQTPGSNSLWCCGKIGSGKTIICSRVVQEIKARFPTNADVAVLYIYCQYDEPGTSDTSAIIRSLIKQLLLQLEATGKLADPVVQEKLKRVHPKGRIQLDASEAYVNLLGLIREFSKVFIVLDGLDEVNACKRCGDDNSDEATVLLRFARRLLIEAVDVTVKLFLASRFEVDVRRSLPSSLQITLSHENVHQDIQAFIEEEVEDKIWAVGLTDDRELVQEIKIKLTAGAHGMFLWAKLQIQAMGEDCNSDIMLREALDELPASIHEIYQRCLLRILRRQANLPYAPRILKWVTYAKRAMRVGELKEAIHIEAGDTHWDQSKLQMANAALVNSCGGLVYLDEIEDAVRIVHPSVKQYLSLEKPTESLESFHLERTTSELELGYACLIYLSFQDFNTQISLRRDTTVSWEPRLPETGDIIDSAAYPWVAKVAKFFINEHIVNPAKLRMEATRRPRVPDHVLRPYKFFDYARSYWAHHTNHIEESSPLYVDFKRLATEPNNVWMLQPWLGEAGTRTYTQDLFEWAVNNEHTALLKVLSQLDRKYQLSFLWRMKLRNGKTAIHHAAAAGLVDLMEFFLSVETSPAPLLHTDHDRCTPLHSAASHSQVGSVQVLLQHAAEKKLVVKTLAYSGFWDRFSTTGWINARGNDGTTALFRAVESGSSEIVRLLLQHSASLKAHKPTTGMISEPISLLYLAAQKENPLVVKELLQFEESTEDVERALKIAVDLKHIHSTNALLVWAATKGFDIDPKDIAVKMAIRNGQPELLQTLLFFRDRERLRRLGSTVSLLELMENGKVSSIETLLRFNNQSRIFSQDTLLQLLHHAIKTSALPECVELFITHSTDINGKWEEATPLRTAVLAGNLAAVTQLLDRGADITAQSNGESLASTAIRKGDEPILRKLIQHGICVNETSTFADLPDQGQISLLEGAIRSKRPVMVKTLLECGADRLAKDGSEAFLLIAIQVGHLETITLLLEFGANIRNEAILEAMYIGEAFSNLDSKFWSAVLTLLAQNGLKIDEFWGKSTKRTLLMNTVEKESPKWIQSDWNIAIDTFLNLGASLNVLDKTGKTALDYASTEYAKKALGAKGAKTGSTIREERFFKFLWFFSFLFSFLVISVQSGFHAFGIGFCAVFSAVSFLLGWNNAICVLGTILCIGWGITLLLGS